MLSGGRAAVPRRQESRRSGSCALEFGHFEMEEARMRAEARTTNWPWFVVPALPVTMQLVSGSARVSRAVLGVAPST